MRNSWLLGFDEHALVASFETEMADVLARRMRRDKAKGRGGRKFGGLGAETEKGNIRHKKVADDKTKGGQKCQHHERR